MSWGKVVTSGFVSEDVDFFFFIFTDRQTKTQDDKYVKIHNHSFFLHTILIHDSGDMRALYGYIISLLIFTHWAAPCSWPSLRLPAALPMWQRSRQSILDRRADDEPEWQSNSRKRAKQTAGNIALSFHFQLPVKPECWQRLEKSTEAWPSRGSHLVSGQTALRASIFKWRTQDILQVTKLVSLTRFLTTSF